MAQSCITTSTPSTWVYKQVFSLGEAARYLGLSASTVRRRIAAGALRAERWGRGWLLWRGDLDWYCTRTTGTGDEIPEAYARGDVRAAG
jgi:excisionase family DNA binding protein